MDVGTIGTIVVAVILVFLALFFWSSGALIINDEERADLEEKSEKEIAEEAAETMKADEEVYKQEEKEHFITRG